jgi:hypothetical protein
MRLEYLGNPRVWLIDVEVGSDRLTSGITAIRTNEALGSIQVLHSRDSEHCYAIRVPPDPQRYNQEFEICH